MRDDFDISRERTKLQAEEGNQQASNAGKGNRDSQADGVGAEAASGEVQPGTSEAPATDTQRLLNEQQDKYLRLAAEFDNYRKRTMRERQETSVRAQGELVKKLLDSLDDLGRVTAVSSEGVNPKVIIDGVDAVQKKLFRALSSAGLEVINPVDQPFNPELHEAVGTERALSQEDDHLIAQVYQPGYVFQGQLLRPARVVVKQWAD